MTIKRQTGRPRRDPVDKYRVQTWFNCVSENGLRTPYELELEFSPENFKKDDDGNTTYPCTWAKYRSGKITPSAALLVKVEERYPGSIYWFNHPIWKLLTNTYPSPELLKASIAPAKNRLTKVVGEYYSVTPSRILRKENTYNYFYRYSQFKRFTRYSEEDSIDRLMGALALLNDADIRKCRIQHIYSYHAVLWNIETACMYFPYITVEMLFERVFTRFPLP